MWSRELIGDEAGMTGRQVTKYIRLTQLIPELLECVDLKKMTLAMGVDLSYLDEQVQEWVYEYYHDNGFLKPIQVEALKNGSDLSNATQFQIITILNEALPKKNTAAKVSFSEKSWINIFRRIIRRRKGKISLFSYWSNGVSYRKSFNKRRWMVPEV